MISICSPFLEYLGNEKCLRAEVFCLFIILPLTFSQEKSLLKQAKYFAHPNKNLNKPNVNKVKESVCEKIHLNTIRLQE